MAREVSFGWKARLVLDPNSILSQSETIGRIGTRLNLNKRIGNYEEEDGDRCVTLALEFRFEKIPYIEKKGLVRLMLHSHRYVLFLSLFFLH